MIWNQVAVILGREIPKPQSSNTIGQFLGQVDSGLNLLCASHRDDGHMSLLPPLLHRSAIQLRKDSSSFHSSNGANIHTALINDGKAHAYMVMHKWHALTVMHKWSCISG